MELELNSRDKFLWSNHLFSVELNSKDYLKTLIISNNSDDTLLIEGYLGDLEEVSLVEGLMFEVKGAYGSLKMDLRQEELKTLCAHLQKVEKE
jgi:hypothetical protein